MSQCKSCNAEILWVTMERSGKKNPLDVKPADDGNIVVMSTSGNQHTARAISDKEREHLKSDGLKLYKSHFVSCPQSKLHRKEGGAQ